MIEENPQIKRVFLVQYVEPTLPGANPINIRRSTRALEDIRAYTQEHKIEGFAFLMPPTKTAEAYFHNLQELPKRMWKERELTMVPEYVTREELGDLIRGVDVLERDIFSGAIPDKEIIHRVNVSYPDGNQGLVIGARKPVIQHVTKALLRQKGMSDFTIDSALSMHDEARPFILEYAKKN